MAELPRSRQIWAICTKFGLLPNDPRIRELTPFQMLWLISNMNDDAEAQARALKSAGGNSQHVSAEDFAYKFSELSKLASNA